MRVLAYKPDQLKDSTYSGVGSMTWSQVEQGIGIVCACLPTLRPLLNFVIPNRSKLTTKNSSGVDMKSYDRSTKVRSEVGTPGISAWKPQYDNDSMVGFAKLHDQEAAMSPADVQRSVYTPIGAAISTSAGKGEKKIVPAGIMKEQTMDQRSEIVD